MQTPLNSCSCSQSAMTVFRDAKLFLFSHLQQGFSFSFFIPGPVVKRRPTHDVWLSSSGEVKGFIGRVKIKPLICLGLSKVEARPLSSVSVGWLRQCTCVCMCTIREVSGSCSFMNISFGEWFQTCGAAWVRLASRLFPADLINMFYTFHKKLLL